MRNAQRPGSKRNQKYVLQEQARQATLSLRKSHMENLLQGHIYSGSALELCLILGRHMRRWDVTTSTRLRSRDAQSLNRSSVFSFCLIYVLASNFLAIEVPLIGRTSPNTGLLNHGRSCLPTMAQAMPA
jgi:hypothetical protein